MLRIYQNIIRMFFMLVLCQSGDNSHHNCPYAPVFWICEQSSVNSVWAVAEQCLQSIKSFSISHSVPSVRGRKGSGWVCGCLAVVPGHPTRVQTVGS